MISNMDIECFDERHMKYSFGLVIPGILLWVIIVPGIIMAYLIKNVSNIWRIEFLIRFGFLYNGYKDEAAFWEFVLLYKKVAILMCIVFFNMISVTV